MKIPTRANLDIAAARHKMQVYRYLKFQDGDEPTRHQIQFAHARPDFLKLFSTYQSTDLEALINEAIWTFDHTPKDSKMNIFSTELFQYISGDMIGSGSITLTIADVTMKSLSSQQGDETKPVVSFRDRDKELILNKTNARFLAKELGPETDNWRGMRIKLIAPEISAFGRMVRAVTINAVLSAEDKKTAFQGGPLGPETTNGKDAPAETEDDIDFDDLESALAAGEIA